ncbi:hypothetical protein K2X33_15665 [bacterium]|nr:hypothetical protein [bacterium]
MRDKSKGPFSELYDKLRRSISPKRRSASEDSKWQEWRRALRGRFPEKLKRIDLKKVDENSAVRYLQWVQRGLFVLGIFFLSGIAARLIGSFIKPAPVPTAARSAPPVNRPVPKEDYEAILRRNMFNVENTIPPPFDQGQLDCFSQAKLSSAPVQLLGTIVMTDDKFSVALVQEDGNAQKTAVKKDELFFNDKYQAMKVERNRLCFQIRTTQDFEYIEVPNSGATMSGPTLQSSSDGITPVSENQFQVNQGFLEKNLLNLNEILQTARAVPYIEPGTGKFRGFLIQSMDPSSPFSKLGIRQGDVLTAVNDIVLDNMGKGLEAFQQTRGAPRISLQMLRGGQPTNMTYDVKP